MREEEVFVRAYCAALTGSILRLVVDDPEPTRDEVLAEVKYACTSLAEDAVDAWRNRSTVPGRPKT